MCSFLLLLARNSTSAFSFARLDTYRRDGGGAVAGTVTRLLAGRSDPLQSESLLLENIFLRNEEMQLVRGNLIKR